MHGCIGGSCCHVQNKKKFFLLENNTAKNLLYLPLNAIYLSQFLVIVTSLKKEHETAGVLYIHKGLIKYQ